MPLSVTITPEFRLLNYAEAGLWAVMALVIFVTGMRRAGRVRDRCFLFAATLLAFGVSDVVEVRTGAWWQPWWLLLWKGACLLAMAALAVDYYASRRRPPG